MFRFTTSTTTRTPRPCPLAFLFCILLVLISARLSLALPGDAEGPTFISIPLVRTQSSLPTTTSNGSVYTHGSVVQQQHANRALKRFAVMTGRTPPSEYELLLKIYERIILLSTPKQRVHEIKQIEEILAKLLKATQHTHTVGKSTSTGISAGTSAGQALPTGVEAAVITTRPQARTWSSREPRNTCGGRGRFDKRSNAARQTPINSTYRDIGLSIESNDYGYMVVMKMGSPPKTFNLLVDSGSSDLWVGAEGCQGDDGGSCGKHNFLGPRSSTTFKQSNESWAIGYVSGTVDGYLVTDDVSIAGLRLPGHRFGVATSESDSFTPDYIPFDGLLGLGKESLSQQRVPTLLQSLFQAKLIPSAVVSYRLPRLADGQNNGIMTIGGMDPKLYISKTLVVKKNVNKFGYWGVNVDSVKVGTRGMGWSNRTVVMDTGTTLILAPQHDVDAIHANIPGAVSDGSGWRVPCNMTTVISLTIGGQAFAIDPRDIAFYPVEAGSTMCMSGIAVGGVGPFYLNTEWLVGDVFLKNVYFSTDDTKDVISIALPKK